MIQKYSDFTNFESFLGLISPQMEFFPIGGDPYLQHEQVAQKILHKDHIKSPAAIGYLLHHGWIHVTNFHRFDISKARMSFTIMNPSLDFLKKITSKYINNKETLIQVICYITEDSQKCAVFNGIVLDFFDWNGMKDFDYKTSFQSVKKYSQLHKHRADFVTYLKKDQDPAIMKNTEVLKNPDARELRKMSEDSSFAGYLLPSGDVLVWSRYSALHSGIQKLLKLPLESIPFDFYYGIDSFRVTDSIERSSWKDHKKEVWEQFEGNLNFENLGLNANAISYYNEDIVGDWKDLEDDND